MDKATPQEMRKALVTVEAYKKAGIDFVPIPILDNQDKGKLIDIASARLQQFLDEAERL